MVADKGKQHAKAGRRANADSGAKPQNHRRKGDMAQSKQELLAALTRQAEVNTRILERERAAVLALEIQTVESQTQRQNGHGFGPRPNDPSVFQAPIRVQHGPAAPMQGFARNKAPPAVRGGPPLVQGKPGKGCSHVFLDGPGQKKVYDHSQVPGLMGGGAAHMGVMNDAAQRQPWTPLEGQENQMSTLNGADMLEGTFPDSPGFYPGMVFGVPGSQRLPKPPPGAEGQLGTPGSGAGDMRLLQPDGTLGQQRGGRGASPRDQNGLQRGGLDGRGPQGSVMGGGAANLAPWEPMAGAMSPPPPAWAPFPGQQQQQQEPALQQFGGWGGGGGSDRGREQDARRAEQAARRRELDEQVRAKQLRKDADKAALRRAQQREDAQGIAAAESPWGARGLGGGGEPLRDAGGRPMADLRGAGGPSPGAGRGGQQPFPGPWQAAGPGYPGPGEPLGADFRRGPSHNLSVLIPGLNASPGPRAGPGGGPRMGHGGAPPPGPFQAWPPSPGQGQPGGGAWGAGPPHGMGGGSPRAGGDGGISPGAGPGGRRFMAGLHELRPGPSEDQRQHQEMQRRKLQEDLAEQIRQKREREARAKAEEKEAREKEEREMQHYHQQLQAQKDAEQHARGEADAAKHSYPQQQPPMGTGGPQYPQQPHAMAMGGLPYPQQALQPERLQRPPLPPPLDFDPASQHQVVGRRKPKRIIEADWLDKIVLPQQQQAANPPQLQQEPSGGQSGVRPARESSIGPLTGMAAAGAGALGPAGVTHGVGHLKAEISALLQEMRGEQVRLREEFARQADVMQSLVANGRASSGSKDKAFQELHRIKARLSESDLQVAALDDSLDQFVVSTHLVPRNVNAIPSRLATPLEAEWVQAAMAQGDGRGGGRPPGPPQFAEVHGPGAQYAGQYSPGPASPGGNAGRGRPVFGLPGPAAGSSGRAAVLAALTVATEPDVREPSRQPRHPDDALRGCGVSGRHQEEPGERGLYRPISQLPGKPSQIPRAPRGPLVHGETNAYSQRSGGGPRGAVVGPERSNYGQEGLRDGPSSRTAGFINLHEARPTVPQRQQQQQRQQRRQPMGTQPGRPISPPILRADHLPSPDRRREKRGALPAPSTSRFAGGKGAKAAAPAAVSEGPPKAGRRAAGKPPLIPQASNLSNAADTGTTEPLALQPRLSNMPPLPPIAPPTRPASSSTPAGPKAFLALEGSVPRAASAPTHAEESVGALAAAAAGMGSHTSTAR